jgi:hypothetical protein
MRIENRTKAPIMVPVYDKAGKPDKDPMGAGKVKTIYPQDKSLRTADEPEYLTIANDEWTAVKKASPSIARMVETGDLRELG